MRQRRVQQRAVETRRLLLETALEVLAESGYADFSGMRVGVKAGVSRGKLVHYFPTKVSLVSALLEHLAELIEENVPRRQERWIALTGRERIRAALDGLWREHSGPLFTARMELLVRARTDPDPDLRDALVNFERRVVEIYLGGARTALGRDADRPGFADSVIAALSTMRGLGLVRATYPPGAEAEFDAVWEKTRDRLVLMFVGLPEPP